MSPPADVGSVAAMPAPPAGAWVRQPGRGGTARGRGGHSTAGRNNPWGSSSAHSGRGSGRGAWGTSPANGEVGNGNKKPSAYEESSVTGSSEASWPSLGLASQSAAARRGSAPWKARPAQSVSSGTSEAPTVGASTLEGAFSALKVESEHLAEEAQPTGSQLAPISVNTSGCEFSNEPQALEQLHKQEHIQDLGMVNDYDPEQRDPSNTQLRIASLQVWDEDRLERGCMLLNQGYSKEKASRMAGVLKADLLKYWSAHHNDSDDGSDSDY